MEFSRFLYKFTNYLFLIVQQPTVGIFWILSPDVLDTTSGSRFVVERIDTKAVVASFAVKDNWFKSLLHQLLFEFSGILVATEASNNHIVFFIAIYSNVF